VDADRNQPGIQELKEWVGVVEYIRSFPDTDGNGIPDIPDRYKGKLGRIVPEPSWNPVKLLSRGTMVTWGALGAAAILILLLALIPVLALKITRRRGLRPSRRAGEGR
jgi:5'-nucleotidase